MDRLQKIISISTEFSRRSAEKLIADGKVKLNGVVVTQMGVKADPKKDVIEIDNKIIDIKIRQSKKVIAFNKPVGIVCSMKGKNSLNNYFEKFNGRFFHIGRLDKDSSGLLLLTNNGDFANKIMHPSSEIKKEYLVTIKGNIKNNDLIEIQKGIKLKDEKQIIKFDKVKLIDKYKSDTILEIIIHMGKNRIIRRVFEHFNYDVKSLTRLKIGKVSLGDVPLASYRYLSNKEIEMLEKNL
jgi:pseudouridine synthase